MFLSGEALVDKYDTVYLACVIVDTMWLLYLAGNDQLVEQTIS